ncbi:MAG: BMP family ABC transporter substrate-binding protein [Lachnospiraceae bacterium]|nr:BMP family ABC transporter substrate-binding protein [Lachnospiraceae bacterium]
MNKYFKLIGVGLLSLCLVGCANNSSATQVNDTSSNTTKETSVNKAPGFVALVTEFDGVDDKSFNQASWEGVNAFAVKSKYRKKFYPAAVADSVDAKAQALDKAIKDGAEIVVCPGSIFETIVYDAQTNYKDVSFILIDAEPKDAQGVIKSEPNVYSILYKEEEVGYLAGYCAVMEGYRKLGFMGGMEIPSIKAFGYGYIQGAEAAAKKLALPAGSLQVQFKYVNGFLPTSAIVSDANAWYAAGTEVIFSCGGGIVSSIIEAASSDEKRKIIGVDVDQTHLSSNIIFSAMKGIANSVQLALDKFASNEKKLPDDMAGKTSYLGIAEDCVGLSAFSGSWRMPTYTVDKYDTLLAEMKATPPTINRDTLPPLVQTKVIMNK